MSVGLVSVSLPPVSLTVFASAVCDVYVALMIVVSPSVCRYAPGSYAVLWSVSCGPGLPGLPSCGGIPPGLCGRGPCPKGVLSRCGGIMLFGGSGLSGFSSVFSALSFGLSGRLFGLLGWNSCSPGCLPGGMFPWPGFPGGIPRGPWLR